MERLYEVSESIFGSLAPGIVAKGWSVFPQEPRGLRRPEVVDGVMLKWRAYQTRLPTPSEIQSWAAQCPAANVAIITGSASGGIFAVDIDCNNEKLAWAIRKIAEREMGRTMLRLGSRPMLVYRCAEPIGCKAYKFERLEDEFEDQAIEILGNGAAFTGCGRHHKTGKYFTWRWGQPGVNKPEDATLVTVDQLRRFIAAVDKQRPFKGCKPTSPGAVLAPDQPVHYSRAGAAIIPHAWASREGKWDLVDGVVIHGRDKFLLAWSYAICAPTENRHLLSSEAGLRQLIESTTSVAFNSIARGGKPERWMEEAIADKIRRTARKFLKGELRSAAPLIPKKEGGYQRAVAATSRTLTVLADPALDWLGNGDVAGKLTTWDRVLKTTGERLVVGALEARALRTDRTETLKRLDAEVNAALSEALADAVEKRPVVHMIPAPTGTGKTRTTAHRIVDFLSGRPGKELVLFLAPTHENLGEAAQHFRDAGAVVFGDKGFETASVKVVHYMSKIKAGCCREADVAALSDSGFGSSGLCEGKVQRRNGETVTWEKATCIHASSCGYQRMRRAAAESRVILAPHAYQTLKAVPVEMKSPTEVVIDESVIFKLAHCDRLPLSVLDLLRSPPAPTKGERADNVDTGQYLVSRDKAVAVVKLAIAEGFDLSRIADRFLDTEGGDILLGDCIAVTGRALEVARDINPESTSLGIERIRKDAKAEFSHLEWRWWKLVDEWYADRKADRIADTLEKETGIVTPRRCLSDGDTRIQLLSDLVGDEEVLSIRVAWLTEPNWSGVPTILLDASAQMEVVESIYAGSTVRRHDISVDLNMRTVAVADATYSTASMTGDDENVDSAKLVDKLRRAVSVVSGAHSFGSVAFGAAKQARAEIMDNWTAPLNLGDGHFGAFRGIDVFKDHVAAIGIGRSEMPIWLVDGIVAALTYKSCPQIPFDVSGTGRLPDGKPLMRPKLPRTLNKRSGHDVDILTPEMPSAWGKVVEMQWREEELRQFAGRLRPVRNSDTPTLVLATTAIPEGLIIDRIVALDDILAVPGAVVFDGMRETGGVVDSVALGFDVSEFVTDNWSAPGFTRLEWTDARGERHKSLVASSWQSDPREALRATLNAKGLLYLWPQADIDPDTLVETPSPLVAVSAPNAVVKIGGVRKPDALRESFLSAVDRIALKRDFEAWWRVNFAKFADSSKSVAAILFARRWKIERRNAA